MLLVVLQASFRGVEPAGSRYDRHPYATFAEQICHRQNPPHSWKPYLDILISSSSSHPHKADPLNTKEYDLREQFTTTY